MPPGRLPAVLVPLVLQVLAVAAPSAVIHEAVEAMYQQNYRRAAEILEQSPRTPESGFWQTCLLQLFIYDSGDGSLIDSFYRLSDQVGRRCLAAARTSPADAEPLLYQGLVELNRANMLGWRQQRLDGLRALLRASRYFSRAARISPADTRVRFGQGVVEYFRACANRYALGLQLFGSRSRAFHMLQEVEKSDALLRSAAGFMLGFMYKEDGQYDSSVACCRRLLRRYPGNRVARRLLRDALLAAGRPESALAVARMLSEELTAVWPDNHYGQAENWLKMSEAHHLLNHQDSLTYYADLVILREPLQNEVPWLRNYVREARRLKQRIGR